MSATWWWLWTVIGLPVNLAGGYMLGSWMHRRMARQWQQDHHCDCERRVDSE